MHFFPVVKPESAIRDLWLSDEESTLPASYFCEKFDGYLLEGRVLPATRLEEKTPKFLAIHGAKSDYTRLNPFLFPLQALGVASLSFNLSGHNIAAGIELKNSSLGTNLYEALQFSGRLGNKLSTVFGYSLGGALALKVAEANRSTVNKIVLSCPAIYSERAYTKNFGQEFRDAISEPFGFLDSKSLAFLRNFEGDLMLIIGQYDGLRAADFKCRAGTSVGFTMVRESGTGERTVNSVIPFEVVEAIENCISPNRFHKIIIPGCDHAISGWLRTNPSVAEEIAKFISAFVNSNSPL
jgi:hypothetical protein